MKRFTIKLAIFGAIHLALLAVVFSAYLKRFPPSESYFMASLDKHSLLRTQASPRLVFIGGSSMAFGIDSSHVANRCGLHPVNMGLHLGIGFEHMLQEVLPSIRSGDVIVVAPEYHAFEKYYRSLPEYVARMIENRPSLIRVLPWRQRKEFIDRGAAQHVGRIIRVMSGLPEKIVEQNDALYKRSGFDANGDFIGHHALRGVRGGAVRLEFTTSAMPEAAVDHLNRFNADCEARGVRVYFSHPPYDVRYFKKYRQQILHLEQLLRNKLTVPMLDTAEEMTFPSEDFFDTEYHLNAAGKRKHSDLVATRLAEALRSAPASSTPTGR
jgi:hypothetical protein